MGHLGCFRLSGMVTNTAMMMSVQISAWFQLPILLGIYSEVSNNNFFLIYKKNIGSV